MKLVPTNIKVRDNVINLNFIKRLLLIFIQ